MPSVDFTYKHIPAVKVELLERLPVETVHQILDYVPQSRRVKVVLLLRPHTHLTACVRTHVVYGQLFAVLDDGDLPLLQGALTAEVSVWDKTEVVKRLAPEDGPRINGRVWVTLNRWLTPKLQSNFLDVSFYTRDEIPQDHTTMGSHDYFAMVTNSYRPSRFGVSRKMLDACHHQRTRHRATVMVYRILYKQIQDIKATQLTRLAQIAAKNEFTIRNAMDPERTIRANHTHLVRRLESRSKACRGWQVADCTKTIGSGNNMASYFRGPAIPLVPLDGYLDLAMRVLAKELNIRREFLSPDPETIVAQLQSQWCSLVLTAGSQESAAEELWKRSLHKADGTDGVKSRLQWPQLGSDIETFLDGLCYLYDYKRDEKLLRIEPVPGTIPGERKRKQIATPYNTQPSKKSVAPDYRTLRARYEKPTPWISSNACPCKVGEHAQIRQYDRAVPGDHFFGVQWQFIDYMSIESRHRVAGDALMAPMDEREIKWLEACLRLGNVFRTSWAWAAVHDGECVYPPLGPRMHRVNGVRRAAWIDGLEAGRGVENLQVAAKRIIERAGSGGQLPGKLPSWIS